jgi:hypothetical protein
MRKVTLLSLILLLATVLSASRHDRQAVTAATTTYRPPGAFQVFWSATSQRLDVDVYPNGAWQYTPDCYDWPPSCWEVIGDRWSFRVAKDDAGVWTVVASSGDYTPDEHGMEQALVTATLTTLNTGDTEGFDVFEPPFDDCYVALLVAIAQGEPPSSTTWPEAGPWSRCPL